MCRADRYDLLNSALCPLWGSPRVSLYYPIMARATPCMSSANPRVTGRPDNQSEQWCLTLYRSQLSQLQLNIALMDFKEPNGDSQRRIGRDKGRP